MVHSRCLRRPSLSEMSLAVSVTGYDDTADSLYFQPPLTTVAQDFNKLGKRAVELLIQQIAAPQMRVRELLPTRLILRQSTWPLQNDAGDEKVQLISTLKTLVEKL
ncbi:substrate-binding domain-containing protein [Yokenella regensburgei]